MHADPHLAGRWFRIGEFAKRQNLEDLNADTAFTASLALFGRFGLPSPVNLSSITLAIR